MTPNEQSSVAPVPNTPLKIDRKTLEVDLPQLANLAIKHQWSQRQVSFLSEKAQSAPAQYQLFIELAQQIPDTPPEREKTKVARMVGVESFCVYLRMDEGSR